MEHKSISITYTEYPSIEQLHIKDKRLIERVIDTLSNAYAPYSGFKVAAAVELDNNKVVFGNNQENAAYPSGLCAERVALFAAKSAYPKANIKTVVIAACNAQGKIVSITPCGACCQVLAEYEDLGENPIRIILYGENNSIKIINGVTSLLPFRFSARNIKQ